MSAMISYSHLDRAVADGLIDHLRSENVSAWIDHQKIAQGAQWRDELMNQLRECDAFIPLISDNYLTSEHCRMELLIARSFDRKIIPIMLDNSWSALSKSEATKSLDDLFILNLHGRNIVGYRQRVRRYSGARRTGRRQKQQPIRLDMSILCIWSRTRSWLLN
jgi:hypothetical protein